MAAISAFWTLTMIPFFMDVFNVANGANAFNLIVYKATSCPDNKADVLKRSKAINCTEKNPYVCLPNKDLTTLLEMCHYESNRGVSPGLCPYLDTSNNYRIGLYECDHFPEGCPNTWDEPYAYPNCWRIENGCFLSDTSCMRSLTVTSDTTQSTLDNKTSNGTTADTNDREIYPLHVLLPLIGILGIAVIITIVAWKIKRRRKKITQPEEVGEESRLLGMEVNDIERLGIDYLLHSLPLDQRTFPMIAEKLNIPHEILNWSLENREKFVRSMKAGNIPVYNGRAMVIGCARAGKTTLVKKIKGDKNLETESTSGIEIHSHAFKLNSDESTIIVCTDEEKEKGCLCLAPGMLDILDDNTQETSFCANEDTSSLPSFTGIINSSNNGEVICGTDPEINDQPIHQQDNKEVDASPENKDFFLKLNEEIDLKDCVASVNMDNLKMLSLLDFAGHSAYYACHHIFFSPRAFFILVVDMSKELSDIATEACRKKGLIYSEWTYAEYIKYWLGSIHTYSSREAPVIVALSHAEDNGADPEKAVEYFHNICRDLPKKLLVHLDESRLFSFEKESNKNENDFKKCLVSTMKLQPYWGERVPISWTKLESVLKTLKEGSKVFPFSNLFRIVSKTKDLGINSEMDLLIALTFFNETGVILFQAEIKDIIILDVQWFVDAFKCIILDEMHAREKGNLDDFDELNERGLLSNNLLKKLWQNSNFYQYKESIVNHMKRLDMLAEISKELWYVPCMNKQKYPWKILNRCNVSSRFCFLFEFLPFIIYHRLVVACINDMGMKPWRRSERMCIYHTVTILTCKDDTHRVLIAICDNKERTHRDAPYSIEIQINVTKPRKIDTRLTSKLKEDISQSLTVLTQGISSSEFYSHVGYRCRLETFGKNEESHIIKEEEMSAAEYDCPKCSQPHIVDVGSIRRFWEKTIQDEPHTSSTENSAEPNTSSAKEEAHTSSTAESRALSSNFYTTEEKDNLTRVSRLILRPCTDQLRDLLRFYIPPASFPAVIERVRSRLPRLTESQQASILPNSGSYSGNYDDLDIVLLYILLRNVCGIQAHNRGWGNQPDSGDRSVSANIDRIWLARNRCGPTPGEISNADYKKIWSEIRAAVVDLDTFLGIGIRYQRVVDFLRSDTMDPV
uniref:Uncharacterized protein LOC111112627 isoform X3 n=1 Tax=Crassostrea virginica TaxID=6565 RepID=A0A8B8BRN9_CRAVI|nr:uncharacterized protein LOC111112627 isoform X3 [Crassostrea virginica]